MERVIMDASFESRYDHAEFDRLFATLPSSEVFVSTDAGLGICKLFFDLGKGKEIFVESDPHQPDIINGFRALHKAMTVAGAKEDKDES